MECIECGLEMEVLSQIFIKKEDNKTSTRTPTLWQCSKGHTKYQNYDDLK